MAINKKQMEKNKAKGIKSSADHAGPEWRDEAVGYIRKYPNNEPFRIEEVREWAEGQGLTQPPNNYCWGNMAKVLRKLGITKRVGSDTAQSDKCHGSVVGQWIMIR